MSAEVQSLRKKSQSIKAVLCKETRQDARLIKNNLTRCSVLVAHQTGSDCLKKASLYYELISDCSFTINIITINY